MLKKNNFAGRYIYHEELEKIISKAVEAEREACAMECVEYYSEYQMKPSVLGQTFNNGMILGARNCSERIRARGK